MKLDFGMAKFFLLFVFVFGVACSSVSLPSVPVPWSSVATQANPDATALFREGMEHFNNKKYLYSIDRFQRVKTEFPFAPEVTTAELKLAESYYLNKQYPEAVASFKEFQTMHPNNENIPFVIYHLGLSHLDQFTAADRDQKMTELAMGYFETVIKNHSNSPYAPLAQEKLAQCVQHLAEQELMVATFYLRKEKYPAARERFEGILRRFGSTPAAVSALFYLGEAYRLEKNTVKAALAYSAFVQRYPEHALAPQAQIHLAEVMQEKQDPLALLLMRDGRSAPAQAQGPESAESRPALPTNMVAKKEVVHETGDEKGFVGRVVNKINPFASSEKASPQKKETTAGKTTTAKGDAAEETEPGFFSSVLSSVNPFAKSEKPKVEAAPDPRLTSDVDSALTQRGIKPTTPVIPPAANLPPVPTQPVADPAATQNVLRNVDAKIERPGGAVVGLPAPPEAHPAFNDPAGREKYDAATGEKPEVKPSADAASVLGSIDQKLKSRGVDPVKTELPVAVKQTPSGQASASSTEQNQKVELDSRLPAQKGPLFMGAGDLPTQVKPEEEQKIEDRKERQSQPAGEPALQLPSSVFQEPRVKETPLDANSGQKEEPGAVKGVLDQMKKDAEDLQKVLNPFKW